jgi:hypothetical protein
MWEYYETLEKLQIYLLNEFCWISRAIEGDSPVVEKRIDFLFVLPSNAGHEKPRMNLAGPSAKAKYYLVTDSEPVPWGKGEKHPERGVK